MALATTASTEEAGDGDIHGLAKPEIMRASCDPYKCNAECKASGKPGGTCVNIICKCFWSCIFLVVFSIVTLKCGL